MEMAEECQVSERGRVCLVCNKESSSGVKGMVSQVLQSVYGVWQYASNTDFSKSACWKQRW